MKLKFAEHKLRFMGKINIYENKILVFVLYKKADPIGRAV